MYVVLKTGPLVTPIGPGRPALREQLNSLHGLFGKTREVLAAYGPVVAAVHDPDPDRVNFGAMMVTVLNKGIRPVLTKWHPLLTAHEATRPANLDALAYEQRWDRAHELTSTLEPVHVMIDQLATVLSIAVQAELALDESTVRRLPPGQ